MDEIKFVEKIRDVLDMEEGETLEIRTPQFERTDDVEPSEPPLTWDAMDQLKTASESDLKELGLKCWSKDTGLWLLPHEWHAQIPPKYPLLSIMDEPTCMEMQPANPDKRHGVLSVGIVPEFEVYSLPDEIDGE